jgi:DNA-binding transcriptional LysR family regulator
MRMYNPPHPGEVIREYLGEMTVSAAAEHLGVAGLPSPASSTARPLSRRRWPCVWPPPSAPPRPKSGCACRPSTTSGRSARAKIRVNPLPHLQHS